MYQQLLAVECDNQTASHGQGLAAEFYTDPTHYELEKKRIFYRSWICVGHVCMAKATGDYFVASVAGQEVVVIRDDNRRLNAFFNACQHRGHRLASDAGHCDRFTCPYHAWSYGLDGRLLHAPHSERVPGFDTSKISLVRVQLDTLAGAIFVNLDRDAPSLHSIFPGVEDEILAQKPDVTDQELVYEYPMPHHCNWKASVENFSECYHCGPVHGYLATNIIDPDSYRISANRLVQRHVVEGRNGLMTQVLWHLWPNVAMGIYPIPNVGVCWCIRHMTPITHDESIYHYRWFCDADGPADAVREYAIHHAETTGAEDSVISTGVQRGMESLGFQHAHLLSTPQHGVSSEHVIKYFHDLIKVAMD